MTGSMEGCAAQQHDDTKRSKMFDHVVENGSAGTKLNSKSLRLSLAKYGQRQCQRPWQKRNHLCLLTEPFPNP